MMDNIYVFNKKSVSGGDFVYLLRANDIRKATKMFEQNQLDLAESLNKAYEENLVHYTKRREEFDEWNFSTDNTNATTTMRVYEGDMKVGLYDLTGHLLSEYLWGCAPNNIIFCGGYEE